MPFSDDCREIESPARDPLDAFTRFAAEVRARLDAGRAVYGDRSFERPPGELLDEIRAELLDVCGWAYILAERLERLRATLEGGR